MAFFLLIFTTLYAAFCVRLTVRLTVRMVNHTDPRAKWKLTALLAAPILYVLSLGPAVWLCQRDWLADESIVRTAILWFYRPIDYAFRHGSPLRNSWADDLLFWYVNLWHR